jgi:hypothetical protein
MDLDLDLNLDFDLYILPYSSLIFLINVLVGIWFNLYVYSFLFLLLTISSVSVHTEDILWINIVDKLIIVLIFFYGSHLLWEKKYSFESIILIISTFLFCVVVYIYGFAYQCFCFDESKNVAQCFHALMHIIGSFGHLLLIC